MNIKIWFFILLFSVLIYHNTTKVEAESEYGGYSEVIMQEGKLLDNFTEAEYNAYYPEVDKVQFWGWRVNIVNKNVPCTYIKNTVYETANEGDEIITHEIDITTEQEIRTILNASGSISYNTKGDSKKFKHDLDVKVSLEYKYQNTESNKRTEKLKIPVEGKTKLLVTIVGSGYVTNGVGVYYMAWFKNQRGGFEYFTITNEFQKIEKVSI